MKNVLRLSETQLHTVIKNSVNRVLAEMEWKPKNKKQQKKKTMKEDINDDDAFYRVQVCDKNGGERAMPEDFPSYEEALDYARNLHPSMGECVEIYKMCERGGKVDFIDQVH